MCGTSAFGLLSDESAELKALSLAVNYGEPNDGAVGIASCSLPGRNYSTDTASAACYSVGVNHFDGTCRHGNGLAADRKPCNFYTNKTAAVRRGSSWR